MTENKTTVKYGDPAEFLKDANRIMFSGEEGEEAEKLRESYREKVNAVLATIRPGEEKVLRLRFGLDDGKLCTLKEISDEFCVTVEKIRQTEAVALRKLRHPSRMAVMNKEITYP